jgi:hypothetical protein
VVLPQFLVFEEVSLDLFVELFNALVEKFLLFGKFFILSFEFIDFLLDFRRLVAGDPFDGVFLRFFNVIDTFEDVGYIIDSSLLHSKFLNSFIEVDAVVFAFLDKFNKLFSKD